MSKSISIVISPEIFLSASFFLESGRVIPYTINPFDKRYFAVLLPRKDVTPVMIATCLFILIYDYIPASFKNNGAKTSETIVISLISMLIDGPDVSLNGSPTVSPTTAAL